MEKAKKITITDAVEDSALAKAPSISKSRNIAVSIEDTDVKTTIKKRNDKKAISVKVVDEQSASENPRPLSEKKLISKKKKITVSTSANNKANDVRKARKQVTINPLAKPVEVIEEESKIREADTQQVASQKPVQFTPSIKKNEQRANRSRDITAPTERKNEASISKDMTLSQKNDVSVTVQQESISETSQPDLQAPEIRQPKITPTNVSTKLVGFDKEKKRNSAAIFALATLVAILVGGLAGYISWMGIQPETITTTEQPLLSAVDMSNEAIDARDAVRIARIDALAVKIAEYRDKSGNLPTIEQLNDPAWRAWNMYDFESVSICDPLQSMPCTISAEQAQRAIMFQQLNQLYAACSQNCTRFRLSVHLERVGSPLYEKIH